MEENNQSNLIEIAKNDTKSNIRLEAVRHINDDSVLAEIAKNEKYRAQHGRNPLKTRIMWKIKCWARSPKKVARLDKIKGTKREKIYTFCAYDLLECGLWYYVKRFFKKIFKRKGK